MSTLQQEPSALAPHTPAPNRRHKDRSGIVGARKSTLALAIFPALLLMVLFLGVPALQGVRMSFTDWHGVGDINFVGFTNYANALFDSPFFSALELTAVFCISTTVGIMVIATLLATAVSARVKGSRFYRVVWFLPGIAPVSAIGVFWSTAFQPHQGIVNVILGSVGLGSDHAWLASSQSAIYPTIFVTVWASVGFAFLLILGAVEQIPVSIFEAARMDGAGPVRSFFAMTLPLIRPVLVVTATLELIWNFNGFTVIWAMTQGGPGYATSLLPVMVYKQAFQLTNFGLASAMAVMGGIILVVLGLFGLRMSRSRQEGF